METWQREIEQMTLKPRPIFWTTPTIGGVRFRVAQLIFETNADAIDYVRRRMPDCLDEAVVAWRKAESTMIKEFVPNEHEIEVLEALNGDRPPPKWGAWVGACLEFLSEAGYVTRTNYAITEKGKAFLKNRV